MLASIATTVRGLAQAHTLSIDAIGRVTVPRRNWQVRAAGGMAFGTYAPSGVTTVGP
jgi:hypothetical protein